MTLEDPYLISLNGKQVDTRSDEALLYLIQNWRKLDIHARAQIGLLTWRKISRRKFHQRLIQRYGRYRQRRRGNNF